MVTVVGAVVVLGGEGGAVRAAPGGGAVMGAGGAAAAVGGGAPGGPPGTGCSSTPLPPGRARQLAGPEVELMTVRSGPVICTGPEAWIRDCPTGSSRVTEMAVGSSEAGSRSSTAPP